MTDSSYKPISAPSNSTRPPLFWSLPKILARRFTFRRILATALCLLLIYSFSWLFYLAFMPSMTREEIEHILFDIGTVQESLGWRITRETLGALDKAPYVERTTLAETFFPTEACLDDWIAKGTLCAEVLQRTIPPSMKEALKLSVVHTWVNGSDERLAYWKDVMVHRREKGTAVDQVQRQVTVGGGALHFRSHGELQYSLRSVTASLRPDDIADMHLITADFPIHDSANSLNFRMGQTPTWLNLDSSYHTLCSPPFKVKHHSELFKSRGKGMNGDEAVQWRNRTVPSFNSVAIESQLVTLAPDLHDTFIYLNDDLFITKNLTPSDFSSPLFGTVLRMQSNLRVSSTPKGQAKGDMEGEWPSLGYSNWLLDQRFGVRVRPYLQHFVKAYSAPLMSEVAEIWGEELTESAEVRFRGSDRGAALNIGHLVSHYIIERHREALLWSFIVARSDTDHSGTLSLEERKNMLKELGYGSGDSQQNYLIPPVPTRHSNWGPPLTLTKVGLQAPKGTRYSFTSQTGGYAFVWFGSRPIHDANTDKYRHSAPDIKVNGGWPDFGPHAVSKLGKGSVGCRIDLAGCFGHGFLREGSGEMQVEEVFKDVAFKDPKCGDCIIMSLLAASGFEGVERFLPEPEIEEANRVGKPVTLSMNKNWKKANFDGEGGRRRVASLLQRYSYTIGDNPTEFVRVRNTPQLNRQFNVLLTKVRKHRPTFVVLNDDLPSHSSVFQMATVDRIMRTWMETIWPKKTCWET